MTLILSITVKMATEKKYGFNNVATVRKKVAKNKELMLPGIMFWQLDGDLPSRS